jgi:hypothetical protein
MRAFRASGLQDMVTHDLLLCFVFFLITHDAIQREVCVFERDLTAHQNSMQQLLGSQKGRTLFWRRS